MGHSELVKLIQNQSLLCNFSPKLFGDINYLLLKYVHKVLYNDIGVMPIFQMLMACISDSLAAKLAFVEMTDYVGLWMMWQAI